MTLADRIVVMNGGVVQQVGTPLDLYDRPANLFVAGFIGSPTMNILPVVHGRVRVAARQRHAGPGPSPTASPRSASGRSISNSRIRTTAPLRGTVDVVENLGSDTNIYAQIDGIGPLMVRRHGHVALRPGDPLGLSWPTGRIHSFRKDGTAIRVG